MTLVTSPDALGRSVVIKRRSAAEEAGKVLEPLQWLTESSEFARSHVYTPEVLNAVDAARRSGSEKVETVDLAESYLKAAGAVAQQRAVCAVYRPAAVLTADLGRYTNHGFRVIRSSVK